MGAWARGRRVRLVLGWRVMGGGGVVPWWTMLCYAMLSLSFFLFFFRCSFDAHSRPGSSDSLPAVMGKTVDIQVVSM